MRRALAETYSVTLVESPDVPEKPDLAAAALEQKIRYLTDELSHAVRELLALRSCIAEPVSKNRSVRPYEPSELAYRILVGFCVSNASELPERTILEMLAEDEVAVKSALVEMCDHGLMAVSKADSTERIYAVTWRGQRQVLAHRSRADCPSCETKDATTCD